MFIDFRMKRTQPNSVIIRGVEVEIMSTHKYSGVVFDNSLERKHKCHYLESPLPSKLLEKTEIS